MQNTNSGAFVKLQPIVNNNIGAIIEEHNRWWTRFNADQADKENAKKANLAKFKASQNKLAIDAYEGLRPEENAGFLNAQIIENFEKKKPYYRELANKYANGDFQAGLALTEEKEKIAGIVNLNKTYGEKAQELDLQESQGLYNEFLDSPYKGLKDSLSKGMYKLNDDWGMDMYIPDKDEVVTMSPSQLFNNDYLNSTYHKKANFTGNGVTIAKTLLDNEDGNQVITKGTKTRAVRVIKSLLAQDDVEARSWYGNAVKNNLVSFDKPFNELSDIEETILAESYYNENVLPNIQQKTVDKSLDKAIKNARLKKLNREEKEDTEDFTTITPSTDEEGNFVNNLDAEVPYVMNEGDRVFNLKGEPISFGVKGNSNTNITYTDLVKQKDGKIIAIGKQVEKVEETLRGEDGKTLFLQDGVTPKTKTREKAIDIIEYSPRVINNIVRQLEDGEGNTFNDLQGASIFMEGLLEKNTSNTSKKGRFD